MDLVLARTDEYAEAVLGSLWVGDKWLCHSREDPRRRPRDGLFVGGETCVPAGSYRITIVPSRRLERAVPMLWHARQDFGILIHPGHRGMKLGQETRGCIVVAMDRVPDTPEIGRTQVAFLSLVAHIDKANEGGSPISVLITDPPPKGKP